MKILIRMLSLWVLLSGTAIAGDFADCILDKMPGTANGATQAAIFRTCSKDHPGGYTEVKKGSGRGLFGFSDPDSCTIKKSRDTVFQPAATAIAIACNCLYKEPDFAGEMCAYRPQSVAPATTFEPPTMKVDAPPTVIREPETPIPPRPMVISDPRGAGRPVNGERSQYEMQAQADLKRIAERAVADYPYLNTPAGAPVMERIIERRDRLIQQGVYPSIALTQAVNAFAAAYAP